MAGFGKDVCCEFSLCSKGIGCRNTIQEDGLLMSQSMGDEFDLFNESVKRTGRFPFLRLCGPA
jgi:hypothetical protein